ILARNAKRIVNRYDPFIIAITGSVGKSGAKQAIGAVMERAYRTWKSPKNYNTEFGVPLSVLGLETPKHISLGWIRVVRKAIRRGIFGIPDYPDTLVLEMGADKPGDIAKLVAIAPPRIAVITAVAESHAEGLGSV